MLGRPSPGSGADCSLTGHPAVHDSSDRSRYTIDDTLTVAGGVGAGRRPRTAGQPTGGTGPAHHRYRRLGGPSRHRPNGVLDVPPEPWVVGWWSDGVAPGAGTGTVVLDAHLDSHQYGTGPFARVSDLTAGDPATIRDNAGGSHQYQVSEVATYQRTALPVEDLFRQTRPERVVLVTCGGTYRPDAGGWDSNIIVILVPP